MRLSYNYDTEHNIFLINKMNIIDHAIRTFKHVLLYFQHIRFLAYNKDCIDMHCIVYSQL